MTGIVETPLHHQLEAQPQHNEDGLSCPPSPSSPSLTFSASEVSLTKEEWQFEADFDAYNTHPDDFFPPKHNGNANANGRKNKNDTHDNINNNNNLWMDKLNSSARQTEETCSSREDEEGEEETTPVALEQQQQQQQQQQQPQEYQDCLSGKLEQPVMMASASSSPQDEHYHSDDTDTTPKSSGSPLRPTPPPVAAAAAAAAGYSKAAQQVLQENDISADANVNTTTTATVPNELAAVLPKDSAATTTTTTTPPPADPVPTPIRPSCDDIVLDMCNGLADQTLYAVSKFISIFEDDEDTKGPKEQETETATADNTIHIPEECPSGDSTVLVPQVVRQGHVLQQLVEDEDDDDEHSLDPPPLKNVEFSPIPEGSSLMMDANNDDSFHLYDGRTRHSHHHPHSQHRSGGFPKSSGDVFEYANADDSSSAMMETNLQRTESLPTE